MISGAPPCVVIMEVLDLLEVVGQVFRYQCGVMDLINQCHCKLLYSILHPEPAGSGEVSRGEVGCGGEAEQ